MSTLSYMEKGIRCNVVYSDLKWQQPKYSSSEDWLNIF